MNCRHERTGAVKVGTYRDGGEYYVHKLIDDVPKPNGRPKRRHQPATAKPSDSSGLAGDSVQDAKPASLTDTEASTRDRAYRMLLDALTLSAEHRQDLQRRGLTDEQIATGDYRTWPDDWQARKLVAFKLFQALANETFSGIPGFGPSIEIHAASGLLVPVRDIAGRIIALKVRRDNTSNDGTRYFWVSSRTDRNPDGPSPGSPAHVPLRGGRTTTTTNGVASVAPDEVTVRITEGELKADVATALSGILTVSFPGVSSWRVALPVLQALGAKTVRVAFDADAAKKKEVARCLRDCVKDLAAAGYAVELERWPADVGKGIDDVLASGRAAEVEILTGPAALAAAEEIAGAAGVDERCAAPATGGGAEKKSQSTLLVELAQTAELWHAPGDGDAFASVRLTPVDSSDDDCGGDDDDSDAGDEPGDRGLLATWPVRSKAFRRWLARSFFSSYGRTPSSQALQDALNVIEGQATFAGQERPVFVRVASHDGRLYLDLANAAWQVVEIDAVGWRVIESKACSARFRRAKAMLPLPTPTTGGNIDELRRFVNVTSDDWPLLLGWLVAAFRLIGPFPLLALHGEQGSAKSTTARTLRALIDPNTAALRCEPREPRDLMIAANNGWVIALDNLSYIPGWLSDALCRLATGGGFATRTLYENDEETIFDSQRPAILTGIEDLANLAQRSDVLDRALNLLLPRIPDANRRTEAEHWREFGQAHGRILGAVLDAVSAALRSLPTTHIERLPRMADFALWATAAETGVGLRPGEFLAAYRDNRDSANEAALESSPVAKYILQMADAGDWQGKPSELLERIESMATESDKRLKNWPKIPSKLRGSLKRLAPNLRAAGVEIEIGHDGRGRQKRRNVAIRKGTDSIVPIVPNVPGPCFSVSAGTIPDDGGPSGDDTDVGGDDAGTIGTLDVNPSGTTVGTIGDDGDAGLQAHSERQRVTI